MAFVARPPTERPQSAPQRRRPAADGDSLQEVYDAIAELHRFPMEVVGKVIVSLGIVPRELLPSGAVGAVRLSGAEDQLDDEVLHLRRDLQETYRLRTLDSVLRKCEAVCSGKGDHTAHLMFKQTKMNASSRLANERQRCVHKGVP